MTQTATMHLMYQEGSEPQYFLPKALFSILFCFVLDEASTTEDFQSQEDVVGNIFHYNACSGTPMTVFFTLDGRQQQ